MRWNWRLLVCSCLLAFVWCQEDEEVCACVAPQDCVDGIVRGGLPSSSIDYRHSTCNGVKVCCSLPAGESPPSLGTSGPQRGSFEPTSGSFGSTTESSGASSGSFGSLDGPSSSPTGSSGQKMKPPSKAALQGCGVRRYNGTQPKLNINMIRINPDDPENQKLIETFYGELPWLVRILVNGEFVCGGTLISNHAVLTAAHCIRDARSEDISLVAGEWNAVADVEAEAPQKRSVALVVKHDKFNVNNGENDLALLFADTAFEITAVVDQICYPDSAKFLNQNECYAAGWGKGQEQEPDYSPVMRKIHMPILDRNRCMAKFRKTSLGPQFVLLPGFMCAGGTDNRDTCKGDGGGPLFCSMQNEPNRFAVIGVISWGVDCGKGNPTVCLSVPYYYSWIDQHIHDYPNLRKSR